MKKKITTPLELMVSRYEAFVNHDWEYLAKTSLTQSVEELEESAEIVWLGLEVVDSYDNIVEFKARYRVENKEYILHEKSSFIKINGSWVYSDGVFLE